MSLDVTCNQNRNRWLLSLTICFLIILGLATRSSLPLPDFLRLYGGDVLWATMLYYVIAWFIPKRSMKDIGILTCLIAYAIEFSQLIDHPILVAARQSTLRYLLGQGFLWSDLFCYTIGVGIALLLDRAIVMYQKKSTEKKS